MAELVFKRVEGYWQGNDYKYIPEVPAKGNKPAQPAVDRRVSLTSVAVGTDLPFALIFMTHMNVDMDGAGNAYGPIELDPLDYLADAGQPDHYYGVMSVKPTAANPVDQNGMITAPDTGGLRVKVDRRYPDAQGYLPVVQQTGPYAGYFVSTTSKTNPNGSHSLYDQTHYLDANTVSYYALSGGIKGQGFTNGNFGLAIRLDRFDTASFSALGGEGNASGAVGECSYKVFLDIGGQPKKRTDPWADNNFLTCFVLCPRSDVSALQKAVTTDNARDLAAFIALQAKVDDRSGRNLGLDAYNSWVANGRKDDPPKTDPITIALHKYGYVAQTYGRYRDRFDLD
jgi:hypothetical protein